MTIEQFLDSLKADPTNPSSPALVWFDYNASIEEKHQYIETAGELPYASIARLEENTRVTDFNHIDYVDQRILIMLYQKPVNTRTPEPFVMRALYNNVLQAVRVVTTAGYQQHKVSLRRSLTQQPPIRDPETGGLYARVSFVLTTTRA